MARILAAVFAAVAFLFMSGGAALADPPPPPVCGTPNPPPGQVKKCVQPPPPATPTYVVTRTVNATGPLLGAGYYLECVGAGDYILSYSYTVTESVPGAFVLTQEHVVSGGYGAVEVLFDVPQDGAVVTITGSAVCSDAEPLHG